MECRQLTNDLIADFERLAPGERELVESHVERCAPCHGRFEEVRSIVGGLRRATELPPAPLLAQLDAAILSQKPALPARRKRILSRRTLWAVILSGVAAGSLVSWLAWLDWNGTHRKISPFVVTSPKAPAPPARVPQKEPMEKQKVEKEEPKKEEVVVRMGDLNGDGIVDVADWLILMRAIADNTADKLPPEAHINGNPKVDISDAQALLSRILKSK